MDVLRKLPESLIAENGSGMGFVCIWRQDRAEGDESARYGITPELSRRAIGAVGLE